MRRERVDVMTGRLRALVHALVDRFAQIGRLAHAFVRIEVKFTPDVEAYLLVVAPDARRVSDRDEGQFHRDVGLRAVRDTIRVTVFR